MITAPEPAPAQDPTRDPMTRDLLRHYDHQLQQLTLDTIDTCARADLSAEVRLSVALGGLAHVMAMVAMTANVEEDHLHKVVAVYFKQQAERRR